MKTAPFTSSSADYLKVILLLWSLRYGWLVIIPLAAAFIAGMTVDLRWLLVALSVLFLCIPMLMAMIYIYYMLTPEARRAVALKQVTIDRGKHILIEYLSPARKDENGEEIAPEVTSTEIIPWKDVASINKLGRKLVIRLRAERLTVLLVPDDFIQ